MIIGGGPGGYEAALVAAQLGADVTVVDRDGIGGSAVLTDCVPSKTLIATAELMTDLSAPGARHQPRGPRGRSGQEVVVDLARINERVMKLAADQSDDIGSRLDRDDVQVLLGRGRLDGSQLGRRGDRRTARRRPSRPTPSSLATGAAPRTLPTAEPDGERILTWEQVYDLTERPEHLVVVGSGVTGAEFASAYMALGIEVALVSTRDRVLPGEDADAAEVLEDVLKRRGMEVLSKSRMASVTRDGDEVKVTLTDGRKVTGSHCLLALGSIPNTADLGLEEAGVALDDGGFIKVDRVSRTTARGVYAAGDCTGVLMLASVAAMQGRIAMWHSSATPSRRWTSSRSPPTSSPLPRSPPSAGRSRRSTPARSRPSRCASTSRATPGRRCRASRRLREAVLPARTGIIIGGVVVAPRASELMHPLSVAVAETLTADQLAHAFTVYPSMSGSMAEAARRLHHRSVTGLRDRSIRLVTNGIRGHSP